MWLKKNWISLNTAQRNIKFSACNFLKICCHAVTTRATLWTKSCCYGGSLKSWIPSPLQKSATIQQTNLIASPEIMNLSNNKSELAHWRPLPLLYWSLALPPPLHQSLHLLSREITESGGHAQRGHFNGGGGSASDQRSGGKDPRAAS